MALVSPLLHQMTIRRMDHSRTMENMRPGVLLLDIDGTLVDNTAQHIAAWREAYAALGLEADEEILRKQIGKGGDLYVRAIAGEDWDRRFGDEARKLHGDAYKRRLGGGAAGRGGDRLPRRAAEAPDPSGPGHLVQSR